MYFGKMDDGTFTPLRLVIRYWADDWLFVESVWAKADGVEIRNLPERTDRFFGWERDNDGGEIWEWSDAPVTEASQVATLRAVAKAKNVTVRFEGKQYFDDMKLSAQQLKALNKVMAAYEAAGGKLP